MASGAGEQIDRNAGFRWFVGPDWDDVVFNHSTLSRNRERLLGSGAAEALFGEEARVAESRRLLSSDRMVVDGTQARARACHITKACDLGGNPEVIAALEMAEGHMSRGRTLVAGRGYGEPAFVSELREMGIRARPRAKKEQSALEDRVTKRPSYEASLKPRHVPDPIFGWIKNRGRMGQTMLRGKQRSAGNSRSIAPPTTPGGWRQVSAAPAEAT